MLFHNPRARTRDITNTSAREIVVGVIYLNGNYFLITLKPKLEVRTKVNIINYTLYYIITDYATG